MAYINEYICNMEWALKSTSTVEYSNHLEYSVIQLTSSESTISALLSSPK